MILLHHRGAREAMLKSGTLQSTPAMPRVIPLSDVRRASARAPSLASATAPLVRPTGSLVDARGRALRDLRISVTDRCNFRCVYCMPKEVFGRDHPFLPQPELLSFEEIARLARIFKAHGVEK